MPLIENDIWIHSLSKKKKLWLNATTIVIKVKIVYLNFFIQPNLMLSLVVFFDIEEMLGNM